jgi:hypothetical protein
MFRKRALEVQVVKKSKDKTVEELMDTKTFEQKADIVLQKLTKIGAQVFAGVCVYVLLDTYRQVQIAQATNQSN